MASRIFRWHRFPSIIVGGSGGASPPADPTAYVLDAYTNTIFVQFDGVPTATSFTAGVQITINAGDVDINFVMDGTFLGQPANTKAYVLTTATVANGDTVYWIYDEFSGDIAVDGFTLESIAVLADNQVL